MTFQIGIMHDAGSRAGRVWRRGNVSVLPINNLTNTYPAHNHAGKATGFAHDFARKVRYAGLHPNLHQIIRVYAAAQIGRCMDVLANCWVNEGKEGR